MGSLHTPYRNQFSHSRPPAATAASSQCWVAQESYGETADAHTLILAQTLALRNILPLQGNDETCPLVNVPPNSLSETLSALQVVLGIASRQTSCLVV